MMTAIETLDTYRLTETQEGADLYMRAYNGLYGIDPAPYWAEMVSEYGVELAQYEERH